MMQLSLVAVAVVVVVPVFDVMLDVTVNLTVTGDEESVTFAAVAVDRMEEMLQQRMCNHRNGSDLGARGESLDLKQQLQQQTMEQD